MVEPNLFGVAAKVKKPKPTAAAPGDVQLVIRTWVEAFERRFGEKPIITGKDAAACKRLVAHAGVATVVRRLPAYLELADDFLAGQGYPLSLMLAQWNRLIAAERPTTTSRTPDADRTAAYLRRLKGDR